MSVLLLLLGTLVITDATKREEKTAPQPWLIWVDSAENCLTTPTVVKYGRRKTFTQCKDPRFVRVRMEPHEGFILIDRASGETKSCAGDIMLSEECEP